jgi:sigma-B regulation protein RsbU (phosphoserine phosphatase)
MAAARLQVTDPTGRRVVVLDKSLFIMGRRTTADLQVGSTDVSREHAEIATEGDQFVLRDRGSRYGTYVNGEQVVERPLTHGDKIRLGRTDAVEVVFLLDGSTEVSGLRSGSGSEAPDLRQMAAIMNGLRALGSGRVLGEVLTLVLDSAIEVTKAERGFIMLANEADELEFKSARGKGQITLPGTSFTISAKIPREVFQTGQSRIVGDLMDADFAAAHDGTIAIGIRHVLCVPLLVNPMQTGETGNATRIIGVLYLDGRDRSTITSQTTLSSLEAFATQAGLAIESARLYAEAAEKTRLERDLRIAAEIQRALLPQAGHESPLVDLAAASVPCRTIGGDFYDYIDVGDGRFGFTLGDVAGKGPPAALLAAAVQTNFAALAPISKDPADTIKRINTALLRRAIEARFATMFYGVVAPGGRLSYCNAGQEPPLLLRRDGEQSLETGGPVIGLLSVATYEFDSVTLNLDDLIVVCSDGVTEARSATGEEFGRERMSAAVAGCHGLTAEVVLERLMAAVRLFSAGAPQADDITVVVLRYRGETTH